jgi:dTDP-4-dehydrorhamnose reductase
MKERDADVIFNCAAVTDVDGCETHRELAFAVNGAGAGNVAAVGAEVRAHVVHVSTDFVFDGEKDRAYTEDDPPSPLSVYGTSKLQGERLVQERGERWTIVRTAWLYGRGGKNFVDTMLDLGRSGDAVEGVTDQVGSPTCTCDLADALSVLARECAEGVYHAVNKGTCSRFEQIQALFSIAGVACRVLPVESSAFSRPAKIPARSVLDTSKLERDLGHVMPDWSAALERYLASQTGA